MRRSPHVAIVGANGFVGRALLEAAAHAGRVRGVVRTEAARHELAAAGFDAVDTGGLGDTERLAAAFRGCDAVVHTGGVTTGASGEARLAARGILNLIAASRSAGVGVIAYVSGLGTHQYGLKPRCTNPYFLAKLTAEVELLRSGLAVVLARPSYVFGPGEGFLGPLMRSLESRDSIEIPGDGAYRLQPIDVRDAAAAVLAACATPRPTPVLDLVGPEIVAYRSLVDRAARSLEARGRRARPEVRVVERAVAEVQALAEQGGFQGLAPQDIDVLLCDEVSDAGPVEALIGRPLVTLDAMIDRVAASLG